MAKSWFDIQREVAHPQVWGEGWRLMLQWGEYVYPNQTRQAGYRIIWRRPEGTQQSRPARIPSFAHITELFRLAGEQGWADNAGE
jgi:hypothetical protein